MDITTGDRASYSADALEAYCAAKGDDMDESTLRDLLADLMHYSASNGVDFDNELCIARINYEEEQSEAQAQS
jgi:hypothetical protein